MKNLILTAAAVLALSAGGALAASSQSGSGNNVNGQFSWGNFSPFPGTTSWGGTETYQHQAQAGAAGTVQIGPFQVPVSDSSAASSYSTWGISGSGGVSGFGGSFGFTSTGSAGGGAEASAGN